MYWFIFTSGVKRLVRTAGAGVAILLLTALPWPSLARACGVCMTSLKQTATRNAYVYTALFLSLAGIALLAGFFWLVFRAYARPPAPQSPPAAQEAPGAQAAAS